MKNKKKKEKTNEKREKFKSRMFCVFIGKANKIERNKNVNEKKGKVNEMCVSELRKI